MINELISFLTNPIIAALWVSLATQILKKYIKPRFGNDGIYLFLFLVALIVSVTRYIILPLVPEEIIFISLKVMAGAIAAYEILKHTIVPYLKAANNN